MTQEQKLTAAFFALMEDYFYVDGCAPCIECPAYNDPSTCPAVFDFDDDIPFADYRIHGDICREIILKHYIDEATKEEVQCQ